MHTLVDTELRRIAIDNYPSGAIVAFDHDLRYVLAGGLGLEDVGLSKEMLEGRTIFEVFPEDTAAAIEPSYRAALSGEPSQLPIVFKDRHYLQHVTPVYDSEGAIRGGLVSTTEITELARTQRLLAEKEELANQSFDEAPIGMATVGLDYRFVRVNQTLCDLVGYTPVELMERTFGDITHPEDLDADLEYVRQLTEGERRSYQMEKRYFHRDGRIVWISLHVSMIRTPDGDPLYYLAQIVDISTRKADELRLAHAASHDQLTGLWNRRRFEEELEKEMDEATRYGTKASVLLLDLDDLKTINDTHGHAAGDAALKAVARCVKARIRRSDAAARFGGDEFSVLLQHVGSEQALKIASGIIEGLRQEHVGDSHLQASIGIATLEEGGTPGSVLRLADMRLYEAKRSGKGRAVAGD